MTKEEKDKLDQTTKGWFSPLTKTLYIVYETKLNKNNISNLERLRKILLMRGAFDLRKLGNTQGVDSTKRVDSITPKIMTVKEAINNNYEIEEVSLTYRDSQLKNLPIENKKQDGFFKRPK